MSTRKRQRPSARDFFEYEPPKTHLPPMQESALVRDFQQSKEVTQEQLKMYHNSLLSLDPHAQILELIRGRDRLDFLEPSSEEAVLFVLKSPNSYEQFPHPIHEVLKHSHLARMLWGPGKRQIAHGKTIFLGHFQLSLEQQTSSLTTEEVYAIQFSNQHSANMAAQTVEFILNQFLLAENHNLLVQVKGGSCRWFVKNKDKSIDQPGWEVEKKKIPYLRPLPRLKSNTPIDLTHETRPINPTSNSSFEISQLPKTITIPKLLENLIKREWLEFPTEIKLTEENTTDLPIRILLKFSNSIAAKICKLSLFHHGLSLEPSSKNNQNAKIAQFLVDDGDSSIDDAWNIWNGAVIWDQTAIQNFIQSRETVKKEKNDDEQEIDELEEEEKPDAGFGSDDFDEWASTHTPVEAETSRPRRTRQTQSYQATLDANEKAWEKELERLTLQAEQEYLERDNRSQVNVNNPTSRFYQVSQTVTEKTKYDQLMAMIKTRRCRRKQAKEYRRDRPLPRKVKRQRREWRSGVAEDPADDDNSDDTAEGAGDETDSTSDEPDERQKASFNEQQWKRFRQKQRSKRVLEPNPPSDGDDNNNRTVPKSLLTNDQVYQHKFARSREPLPGDVN